MCDTYLTHTCRHPWSGEKIKYIESTLWFSSPVDIMSTSTADESHSVGSIYFIFSPGSLRSSNVYRYESGRCHTLPFFLTFLIKSNYEK